ncbi:hypothetical protein PVK06_019259 [Gossypium arboreum]|uniref:CCHC-type domain-containing protein n=1 Tax=Gossypium arboreum TaxID=29729 RepID=A0ABR0PJP4_GOSAR|nr:hypothetical protein PVK06_019259 [Gossypium arboreum]
MKKGETINEYFVKMMVVTNQIRSNGEAILDSIVVKKILRTLTECFTYVVISIEEVKDTRTMSIDELQNSLFVHEQKFKRMDREEYQVLRVVVGDERLGGKEHGAYRGRERGRERSFDKAIVECYKCYKLGHFQYECPR